MAGFEEDPLVELQYEQDDPYTELLDEANKREFTELENSHCITVGEDAEGLPVIVFVPRLGFEYTNCTNDREKDHHLKRMLLLFIKKADRIVSQRYTLVYAHTSLSILSQQPLVYKYYKMLPRAYKKNVHKVFVLHPTFLIKTFFEMGVRWFVKEKFFKKLNFVKSLAELQYKLPPRCTVMSPSLLLYEHMDNCGKSSPGTSPVISTSENSLEYGSLFDLFDSAVKTIPLVYECMLYLREMNAYSVQGIFRLSMDESVRVLLKDRLSRCAVDKILIGKKGECAGREALGLSVIDQSEGTTGTSSSVRESTDSSSSSRFTWTSKPSEKEAADTSDEIPILVVEGVHNVAGTLKTCFAMLTEPLFTFGVYDALIASTKLYLQSKDVNKWDKTVDNAVGTMPLAHIHTLKTLLSMFVEVIEQVDTNLMDSANLGRVFAPTLLRSVANNNAKNETQMTSAMQEMLLGGQLIARLIDRAVSGEIPAVEEWGVGDSSKTIKSDSADNQKESAEIHDDDGEHGDEDVVGDISKMRFGGER